MEVRDGERPAWVGIVVLFLLLLLGTATGCYRVPEGKLAIDTVTIDGVPSIDDEDLEERITTRKTKRFVGFVYEYDLFDRYALRRDLARIERYLHARGFYDAEVRVARVVQDGKKVHITIEVAEGRPVTVADVAFEGDEAVESAARDALRAEGSQRRAEKLRQERPVRERVGAFDAAVRIDGLARRPGDIGQWLRLADGEAVCRCLVRELARGDIQSGPTQQARQFETGHDLHGTTSIL